MLDTANTLETAYGEARIRVRDLAAGLTGEQLQTPVAATPEWTVRELLAHLVGVAADAVNGRLDGVTTDQWTARQVTERQGHSVGDLLAEWDRVGPAAGSLLTDQQLYGPNMAADVLCHEADLRETLGLPRIARRQWQPFLDVMMMLLQRQLRHETTVIVQDEQGRQWICGSQEPITTLHADGYELLRAMYSRRSQRQIAGWNWAPSPADRVMECFGIFGIRHDDQPVPSF